MRFGESAPSPAEDASPVSRLKVQPWRASRVERSEKRVIRGRQPWRVVLAVVALAALAGLFFHVDRTRKVRLANLPQIPPPSYTAGYSLTSAVEAEVKPVAAAPAADGNAAGRTGAE